MTDSKRDDSLTSHDEEILQDLRRGVVSEHLISKFERILILNRSLDRERWNTDYIEKVILASEEGLLRRKLMTKPFVTKFEAKLWPPSITLVRRPFLDKVDL